MLLKTGHFSFQARELRISLALIRTSQGTPCIAQPCFLDNTGNTGDTGDTGYMSDTGDTGDTGVMGDMGDLGERGHG